MSPYLQTVGVDDMYLYADARGVETHLGPIRLSGAAVVRPAPRGLQVIAISHICL